MKEAKRKPSRLQCVFLFVLVILLLIWEIGFKVSLFHLGGFQQSKIKKINIMLECSAENADYSGSATITDKKEIGKVIHVLKRTKAYRGPYSENNLPGESPSAIIKFYDSANDSVEKSSIYIYYDIAVSDAGEYYKVKMASAHKRIADLCGTYGECYP